MSVGKTQPSFFPPYRVGGVRFQCASVLLFFHPSFLLVPFPPSSSVIQDWQTNRNKKQTIHDSWSPKSFRGPKFADRKTKQYPNAGAPEYQEAWNLQTKRQDHTRQFEPQKNAEHIPNPQPSKSWKVDNIQKLNSWKLKSWNYYWF